jgi:hypothetical protein
MKSERRHELQHNALADWLVKAGEAAKPYQNAIFTVVIAFLVVFLGYTLWARHSAGIANQAWDDLNVVMLSSDVSKLVKITEDYPNTAAADMASIILADSRLAEGCNRVLTSKATGRQELAKAIDRYAMICQENHAPWLVERATFGLARGLEATGDLKNAAKNYKDVVERWPNGVYAPTARQRLEDIERPTTKRFYDSFAHFDPKPSFSSESGEHPNASGDHPKFDIGELPDEPATKSESIRDMKLDDSTKATGVKKSGENKATKTSGSQATAAGESQATDAKKADKTAVDKAKGETKAVDKKPEKK